MGNSGNKQFISFKLYAFLSSTIKSHTRSIRPEAMNHLCPASWLPGGKSFSSPFGYHIQECRLGYQTVTYHSGCVQVAFIRLICNGPKV